MTVRLEHRFFSKKNNGDWIYFGASYLKLKNLEIKIGGKKKISLSNEIYFNSNNQRKNFVHWIEAQRIFFKDSTYWLMNNLASKDNRSSNLFLYICQLLSINQHLADVNEDKKITIISENYFLIKILKDNLEKKHSIETPKVLNLLILLEKFIILFKGFINYLKIIIYFATTYFFAKFTKTKKKELPTGEVYLFHDLINTSNFNRTAVQGRIFGDYPNWLISEKKNVKTLPWFYRDLKNKKNIYKNLRSKNSFIPEDWLSISDYFNSIFDSIKSAFTINDKIKYPGVNLVNLIKVEKLLTLSSKSSIYLRYIPALKKWSKNLTSLIFLDNYQNQIFEQPIRIGLNKLKIKTKSIGYYHSLHSKNFLAYQSTPSEWDSKSKPDYVACSNFLCKSILSSQGIPENKIKVISDFQRENFANLNFEKKFNKNLLIILPLFPESSYEILTKISKIKNYLANELGLIIKVRPHPYVKKENILKKLNWESLPPEWSWTVKNLETDLKESYCIVTMHSSSATDTVISNNILITLKSELNIGENFLDTLEDQFPILKTISEEDLKEKITEVFFTKIELYKSEFLKIKKKLNLSIDKKNYQILSELK